MSEKPIKTKPRETLREALRKIGEQGGLSRERVLASPPIVEFAMQESWPTNDWADDFCKAVTYLACQCIEDKKERWALIAGLALLPDPERQPWPEDEIGYAHACAAANSGIDGTHGRLCMLEALLDGGDEPFDYRMKADEQKHDGKSRPSTTTLNWWRDGQWSLVDLIMKPDGKQSGLLRREISVGAGGAVANDVEDAGQPTALEASGVTADGPSEKEDPSTSENRSVGRTRSARIWGDQPYVIREQHYKNFREALDRGEKIIAFVGSSGVGKSRLARELVLQACLDDAKIVDLRASSETALYLSIEAELKRLSVACKGSSASEVVAAMVGLLSEPGRIDFVIVDDLDESVSVGELIRSSLNAIAVITGEVDVRPSGRGALVEVEHFGREEFKELVVKWLPDCTEEQVAKLEELLAGHALAIAHVCAFIREGGLDTVDTFCRRLAEDVRELDLPLPVNQKTLFVIYTQVLEQLRDADMSAAQVLELVAFVGPSGIPAELLREAYAQLVAQSVEGGDSADLRSFEQAVRFLQLRYLVSTASGALNVHPLTQRILRRILRPQELDRCLVLHRAARARLPYRFMPDRILTTEELRWVPHLEKVLQVLVRLDENVVKGEAVDETLLFVTQGMRQIGDLDVAHNLALAYANRVSPETAELDRLSNNFDTRFVGLTESAYEVGDVPRGVFAAYRSALVRKSMEDQMCESPTKSLEVAGPASRRELAAQTFLAYLKSLALGYSFGEIIDQYFGLHLDEYLTSADVVERLLGVEMHSLVGAALISQGCWSHAERVFGEAYAALDSLESVESVVGRARLAAAWANGLIDRGTYEDAVQARRVTHAVLGVDPVKFDAALNSAPMVFLDFCRSAARVETMLVRYLVSGQDPGPEGFEVDECREFAMVCLFKADALCRSGSSMRSRLEMTCEQYAYELDFHFHDGVELDREGCRFWIERMVQKALELEEFDLALRYWLALLKSDIRAGACDRGEVEECIRISSRFRDDCNLLVAQADSLMVAYIAAVLAGMSSDEMVRLENMARRAADAVGRSGQFAEIAGSVEGGNVTFPVFLQGA